MKIYSDAAVRTGRENVSCSRVAQDYALGGEHLGTSFAVVSDGHSVLGRTDVGARLLCLAAERCAIDCYEMSYAQLLRRLSAVVGGMRRALALDVADLRSTCLVAYARGNEVRAHVYGNGVLAVRHRDGTLWLKNHVWSYDSPPLPMSSELDIRCLVERRSYLTSMVAAPERSGGLRTCSDSAPLEHLMSIATPKKSSVLEQLEASLGHVCSYELDARSLLDLAFFTNGIDSVTAKTGSVMPWETVVTDLLEFQPSPTAGWVRSSMNVFCNRAERDGYAICDDLSCAALHFDHV